VNFYFNNKS